MGIFGKIGRALASAGKTAAHAIAPIARTARQVLGGVIKSPVGTLLSQALPMAARFLPGGSLLGGAIQKGLGMLGAGAGAAPPEDPAGSVMSNMIANTATASAPPSQDDMLEAFRDFHNYIGGGGLDSGGVAPMVQ